MAGKREPDVDTAGHGGFKRFKLRVNLQNLFSKDFYYLMCFLRGVTNLQAPPRSVYVSTLSCAYYNPFIFIIIIIQKLKRFIMQKKKTVMEKKYRILMV